MLHSALRRIVVSLNMFVAITSCQNADPSTQPPPANQPPPPPAPVTPQEATKLAFVVQPGSGIAGGALAPVLQVAVQDVNGSVVAAATTNITVTITAGTGAAGANLIGAATQSAVNGIATFNSLAIQKAASGYTLTATATSLTSAVSSGFDVAPAAAAKLAVQSQPSSTVAGAAITPAVQVGVQDAFGNAVPGSIADVTATLTNGAGASLNGTLTRSATNGVAVFDDLSLQKAAAGYTITLSATGLTSATTSAFSVAPTAASKLQVMAVPANVSALTTITPAVQVVVQDMFGNPVPVGALGIGVAITSGSGAPGAVLSGTLSQSAVSGIATFSNLKIDKVGSGYTLTASASGMADGTSTPFAVNVGAPGKMVFSVQPGPSTAGTAITPSVQLALQDAAGNVVTSATNTVTVAITSGSGPAGAVLSGTTTRAAVGGIATFNNLAIDKASGGYSLTATATSLPSVQSAAFPVVAGAAAKLAFSAQPSSVTMAVVMAPPVQVAVQDAQGNTLSSATTSISLAITAGSGTSGAILGGILTRNAASGVASFNDLTVDKAGAGYTLTATANALTSAISATFAVQSVGGSSCANPAPGWIWCDDFEVDRLSSYFEIATDNGSLSRTSGVGRNGSVGIRSHFAAGQVSAGSMKLAFGRTPAAYFKPVDAGTKDYRELYWRFYFKNDAGWTGGGGDKMTRATVFAASSWAQAMIAHVWSSGTDKDYLLIDPASGTDVAGTLKTTKYNDFANLRWLGAQRATNPIFGAAQVGQWYCIEAHVKLNTAGQSDGVFELRINGQLEASRTGLNWLGTYSAYGLNAVFLESYWNAGSAADQSRYFDDFIVSEAPIGC